MEKTYTFTRAELSTAFRSWNEASSKDSAGDFEDRSVGDPDALATALIDHLENPSA